jgi:hypothetical protein
MALIHDDDLERIDGIGEDSVSGDLVCPFIVHFMLIVTGNPPT